MSDYRSDPRWQVAHRRLLAERTSDETPTAHMLRTMTAAHELRAIEEMYVGGAA